MFEIPKTDAEATLKWKKKAVFPHIRVLQRLAEGVLFEILSEVPLGSVRFFKILSGLSSGSIYVLPEVSSGVLSGVPSEVQPEVPADVQQGIPLEVVSEVSSEVYPRFHQMCYLKLCQRLYDSGEEDHHHFHCFCRYVDVEYGAA